MTARIEAGFDVSREGTFTIKVTEDPSGTPATWEASVTTGSYCPTDISSVMGSGLYTSWASAVGTALTAASAASGKTWTYSVTFSTSTLAYSIQGALLGTPQTTTLEWTTSTTAEGERMRKSLGFSGISSAQTTHTSNVRPYYVLVGAGGAFSKVSNDQRKIRRSRGATAMDGTHYAVAMPTAPTESNFMVWMETLATTRSRHATASVPWTFEHFVDHVKAIEPFLVTDDTEQTVHTLTPEGDVFEPQRVTSDYDGLWHWPFRTYVDGRL